VRVGVLDYGMGNLRSVTKAFEEAGAQSVLVADTAGLARCDALCVPGQGIFGRCMSNLRQRSLDDAILGWLHDGKPYIGICLGMQILFDRSEEMGAAPGLSVLSGEVRRLPSSVRVPHIGWNTVSGPEWRKRDGEYFYFDHSFAAHPADESVVAAWCDHGERFAASVRWNSAVAVQFHPEKSGTGGIEFLKSWVSLAERQAD
jgi:glutamine amidotransferase